MNIHLIERSERTSASVTRWAVGVVVLVLSAPVSGCLSADGARPTGRSSAADSVGGGADLATTVPAVVSVGTAPSDGIPVCPSGQGPCAADGACVDITSDAANCGACGNTCFSYEVCNQGVCALTCDGSLTPCGSACVDLRSDGNNCGACGTVCPTGQSCTGGTCATTCPAGASLCGGTCINLMSDPANCGACGSTCFSYEVCNQGVCALTCDGSLTQCGSACVDLRTDAGNCGACGAACAPGKSCSGGTCQD